MQMRIVSLAVAVCAAAVPPPAIAQDPASRVVQDVTREPTQDLPHDQRMAWWREARFGMFIHWGLYAIPAGEWNGATHHGEWIRDSARIPRETYSELRPQWNPTRFDADAWAKMAADAGMKYLVVTSKHHDGFCLFDSAETDWDTMNTPFGRDVCKELAAACDRHGVRFCTYHSIMDWHHDDYLPRRPWERAQRSAEGADFARFERYLHAQVGEVIARYHPAVMWFDGEWESTWNHERGVRLFELCRRLAPQMIVNNRVDVHRGGMGGFSASDEAVGDFATPEQEIPATGVPGVDWESCMTMNSHWGWNQADTKWKSTRDLQRNLIDVASKGGNYLLNVGPRADGTFPPEAVERLAGIGAWMRTNGEAVHGTTASVFELLPFGRCTVRSEGARSRLYLHVFDWPASGELVLPGLGNRVVRAFLLTAPEVGLPVVALGAERRVRVPATAPDPIATVVVVELEGAPIVYRTPTIVAESSEFVRAVAVEIGTTSPAVAVHYTRDGSEPGVDSPRAVGPLQIADTCTIRARAFHDGEPVSALAERRFTKVVPAPAVEVPAREPGLRFSRFLVDWNSLPEDRTALVAERSGVMPAIGLGVEPAAERVALRFTGFLVVPEDELYRFALASDDGSRLWIDGELVVDNDGLHGTVEKQGARALAAGPHAIEVMWFNKTGGAALSLRWARPGAEFAAVPAGAYRH